MDKLALTIDTELLETNHYGPTTKDTAKKEKKGIRKLLKLLDRHNHTITFFAVSNLCKDHLDILEDISSRGHEIASHTMNHKTLVDISDKELEEEIKGSKCLLEEKLDVEVKGFRAPLLKHSEEVFKKIEAAGYKYDSSMIPSVQVPGWYGGDKVGYKPFKRGNITEIPLSVHPSFKTPISGLFTRFFGKNYLYWAINQLHSMDITPVIYFHPYALSSFKNKNNWRQKIGSGNYTLQIIEELAEKYDFVNMETLSKIRTA